MVKESTVPCADKKKNSSVGAVNKIDRCGNGNGVATPAVKLDNLQLH